MTLRGAVFLDRDGVIIKNRDTYVRSWEEVEFIPGALEALESLARAHITAVVVSNQSAIGRGLVGAEEVQSINERMCSLIRENGGDIAAVYVCPHTPADGCTCRKPAPGMIEGAALELGLSLADSFLVGDSAADLHAALAAEVTPIMVRTGLDGPQDAAMMGAAVAGDLAEAIARILTWRRW